MQGKSNSFLQVSPFIPRSGAVSSSYEAFPLDVGVTITEPVVTPCEAILECRSIGGTATLCGYDEWSSPSTPPKKYRRQTPSGTLTFCVYSGPGCVSTAASFAIIYSGYCTIDPDTCAEVKNIGTVIRAGNSSCVITGPDTLQTGCGLTGDSPNLITSSTPTVITKTGTGTCVFDTNWRRATGVATNTLSDEDTESDAIARLEANSEWSEWSESESCFASYEARTSGFSFDYSRGQFRLTISGLVPGSSNAALIGIYSRAFGSSGEYTLSSTIPYLLVANSLGVASVEADVTNARGFESYAAIISTPCA